MRVRVAVAAAPPAARSAEAVTQAALAVMNHAGAAPPPHAGTVSKVVVAG